MRSSRSASREKDDKESILAGDEVWVIVKDGNLGTEEMYVTRGTVFSFEKWKGNECLWVLYEDGLWEPVTLKWRVRRRKDSQVAPPIWSDKMFTVDFLNALPNWVQQKMSWNVLEKLPQKEKITVTAKDVREMWKEDEQAWETVLSHGSRRRQKMILEQEHGQYTKQTVESSSHQTPDKGKRKRREQSGSEQGERRQKQRKSLPTTQGKAHSKSETPEGIGSSWTGGKERSCVKPDQLFVVTVRQSMESTGSEADKQQTQSPLQKVQERPRDDALVTVKGSSLRRSAEAEQEERTSWKVRSQPPLPRRSLQDFGARLVKEESPEQKESRRRKRTQGRKMRKQSKKSGLECKSGEVSKNGAQSGSGDRQSEKSEDGSRGEEQSGQEGAFGVTHRKTCDCPLVPSVKEEEICIQETASFYKGDERNQRLNNDEVAEGSRGREDGESRTPKSVVRCEKEADMENLRVRMIAAKNEDLPNSETEDRAHLTVEPAPTPTPSSASATTFFASSSASTTSPVTSSQTATSVEPSSVSASPTTTPATASAPSVPTPVPTSPGFGTADHNSALTPPTAALVLPCTSTEAVSMLAVPTTDSAVTGQAATDAARTGTAGAEVENSVETAAFATLVKEIHTTGPSAASGRESTATAADLMVTPTAKTLTETSPRGDIPVAIRDEEEERQSENGSHERKDQWQGESEWESEGVRKKEQATGVERNEKIEERQKEGSKKKETKEKRKENHRVEEQDVNQEAEEIKKENWEKPQEVFREKPEGQEKLRDKELTEKEKMRLEEKKMEGRQKIEKEARGKEEIPLGERSAFHNARTKEMQSECSSQVVGRTSSRAFEKDFDVAMRPGGMRSTATLEQKGGIAGNCKDKDELKKGERSETHEQTEIATAVASWKEEASDEPIREKETETQTVQNGNKTCYQDFRANQSPEPQEELYPGRAKVLSQDCELVDEEPRKFAEKSVEPVLEWAQRVNRGEDTREPQLLPLIKDAPESDRAAEMGDQETLQEDHGERDPADFRQQETPQEKKPELERVETTNKRNSTPPRGSENYQEGTGSLERKGGDPPGADRKTETCEMAQDSPKSSGADEGDDMVAISEGGIEKGEGKPLDVCDEEKILSKSCIVRGEMEPEAREAESYRSMSLVGRFDEAKNPFGGAESQPKGGSRDRPSWLIRGGKIRFGFAKQSSAFFLHSPLSLSHSSASPSIRIPSPIPEEEKTPAYWQEESKESAQKNKSELSMQEATEQQINFERKGCVEAETGLSSFKGSALHAMEDLQPPPEESRGKEPPGSKGWDVEDGSTGRTQIGDGETAQKTREPTSRGRRGRGRYGRGKGRSNKAVDTPLSALKLELQQTEEETMVEGTVRKRTKKGSAGKRTATTSDDEEEAALKTKRKRDETSQVPMQTLSSSKPLHGGVSVLVANQDDLDVDGAGQSKNGRKDRQPENERVRKEEQATGSKGRNEETVEKINKGKKKAPKKKDTKEKREENHSAEKQKNGNQDQNKQAGKKEVKKDKVRTEDWVKPQDVLKEKPERQEKLRDKELGGTWAPRDEAHQQIPNADHVLGERMKRQKGRTKNTGQETDEELENQLNSEKKNPHERAFLVAPTKGQMERRETLSEPQTVPSPPSVKLRIGRREKTCEKETTRLASGDGRKLHLNNSAEGTEDSEEEKSRAMESVVGREKVADQAVLKSVLMQSEKEKQTVGMKRGARARRKASERDTEGKGEEKNKRRKNGAKGELQTGRK